MIVHKDIERFPKDKKIVLTIGSFDGVHLGHRKILERVISLARTFEGESAVITFDPHPRQVLPQKNGDLKLLNDSKEKSKLLEEQGIDHLVLVKFTQEFSQQSPRDYIESFLINNFNPKVIVIGYDHRFGRDRTGNIDTLKNFILTNPVFEIIEIPKEDIEAITISSTKIRNFLKEGNLEQANRMLGYPYPLSGIVERGNNIGSKIGFPTANLRLQDKNKLIPGSGVYAVLAEYREKKYQAMLYIGERPTLGGDFALSIEVNIFDFDADLYGQKLNIHFHKKVREEINFDSLEALREQLHRDRENVLQYFLNSMP
jgi:riboflavin kinase / FMN adenylyltransferase